MRMEGSEAPHRVLHVDDEPDFADMVAAFLERESDRITVETARSASEAETKLAEARFDCIVSDYDMPETDGIEFLERVRASYPDLPFILFTGKGSEEVASDAFSAGATEYLQKGSATEQYELLSNRIENAVAQFRSEQRALETEQRLQELTETTDEILWMFDGDWDGLIFINSGYEDVWGRSVDALESNPRDFLNGVHPDDRDKVEAAMASLSAGEPVDLDFRVDDSEDFQKWVWVQGDPIFDDAGDVVRVTGFTRDITERKEREQDLKQSRNLVTALSTALPDYIFIYDAEGTYLDVITGWAGGPVMHEPEELVGRNVDDIVTDDTAKTILTAISEALSEETIQTVEYTVGTEHGPFWYEGHVAPIPDGYDGTDAVLLTARDITGRKEDERRLQRQNERLEEFAGVVSHDLRNPLNVAQGRIELAQENVDSDHIDTAADALDRIEALVDDLLTLAQQGDEVNETKAVDLSTIADGCWRTVETASARLVVETDQTVRADPSRLKQLLENLFRNSVEHGSRSLASQARQNSAEPDSTSSRQPTDDATGDRATVTVTIGDSDDGDGFYVADNGPGIPEGERDKVFDSGYSTSESGTGFGLAIVEKVVDDHDWDITVSESVDGGARFEISGVESNSPVSNE